MARRLFLAVGVLFITVGACSSSPEGNETPPADMVDEGSWYSRQQWPHDGRPYESDAFVVFSDRAGAVAREEVAEVAEEIWSELLDEFDVEPAMLRYPTGQQKIHIYAYRDHYPKEWGMRAYYAGLIMWSPDHEHRPTGIDDYAPVVRHELVHVIEGLLKGRDAGVGEMTDVWFSEGVAEAIAGGTAGGAVKARHQMSDLVARYGRLSPVAFKRDAQVASTDAGFHYNYPMYQLAVEYLMDDDGLNRGAVDVRDLFLTMGQGASFEDAFEATMGIGLDRYQDTFFERMDTYLPAYRSPVFSPIGFALFAALIAFTIGAALVISYRRQRPEAVGIAPPGRGSVLAFGTEIGLSAIAILGAFLGLMFVFGTDYEFNNAMNAGTRTVAFWTLAAYLLASIGLLLWAIRRWLRASKVAYLVAPLVLGLTLATFAVLASLTGGS